MPPKKKGGKRNRKGKKGSEEINTFLPKRDKDSDQVYGVATKMLGNLRLMAKCEDQIERLCIIPGRFKRRCWISVGTLLLLNLREYQDSKCDVIYVYNSTDVKRLQQDGELDSLMPETEKDKGIIFYANDDEETKTSKVVDFTVDSDEEIDLEDL